MKLFGILKKLVIEGFSSISIFWNLLEVFCVLILLNVVFFYEYFMGC